MKYKGLKLFLFIILILSFAALSFADETVGQIVYLEGIVDLNRNGEIIELFDSDIGFNLENYDLIETGDDGIVEIEIKSLKTKGTCVTVAENTVFYLNAGRIKSKDQTNLTMMTGSFALKVQRLTGTEALSVKTESAVMGVRGTDFGVTTAPEGSVLVTCQKGQVSCKDKHNNETIAKAGRVVEKIPDEDLKVIAVNPGDEDLFKKFWVGKREEIFKAGADTFIKAYAVQYENYLPMFEKAYKNLLKQRDTLVKYGRLNAESSVGARSELIKVKSEVSNEIFKMRSIFPLFEQVFYSVQVLERYHSQGIGHTMIKRKYSSDDFFAEFAKKKLMLKNRLADTRYMFKLFVNISNAATGGFGGPSLLEDIFSGSNPLGSSGPPTSSMPSGNF